MFISCHQILCRLTWYIKCFQYWNKYKKNFLFDVFDCICCPSEPNYVILNSTNIVKFNCVKEIDDQHDFEVEVSRVIPKENFKMTIVQINKTVIEITVEFIDYIGLLHLHCASKGKQSEGTRADVIVGGT